MKDVSNSFLSKLFTAEFFFGALGMMFVVGVTYSSVQAEVKAVQMKVIETNQKFVDMKRHQKQIDGTVNKIQTDIEVIKTNQQHSKEAIEETRQIVRQILNNQR